MRVANLTGFWWCQMDVSQRKIGPPERQRAETAKILERQGI
jgi:hypothetical protein